MFLYNKLLYEIRIQKQLEIIVSAAIKMRYVFSVKPWIGNYKLKKLLKSIQKCHYIDGKNHVPTSSVWVQLINHLIWL